MAEELKSCPYCNGNSIILERHEKILGEQDVTTSYFSGCPSCHIFIGGYKTIEEATAKWNKHPERKRKDIPACEKTTAHHIVDIANEIRTRKIKFKCHKNAWIMLLLAAEVIKNYHLNFEEEVEENQDV